MQKKTLQIWLARRERRHSQDVSPNGIYVLCTTFKTHTIFNFCCQLAKAQMHNMALLKKRPEVTLGGFGGATARHLEELLMRERAKNTTLMQQMNQSHWPPSVWMASWKKPRLK